MRTGRATARRWGLALVLTGAILALPARSQSGDAGLAAIPAAVGYVNDHANVIPEARRAELEAFLDQVHTKTGAQFAILTVTTSAPEEPATYKTRVFKQWGIGDPERDDGLLMLVSIEQRKLLFETGYGLEGTLPDGWLSRMYRDLAMPHFKAGNPSEGITAAVLAASQRIAAEKGVTLTWDGRELRYTGGAKRRLPSWIVLLATFFLFFVVMPAVGMSRGRRSGRWYSSGGGWGGGFGGYGGGFGGGGGGGGGSSFGGFGGGSSGGGGGGGSW